MKDVIDFEKIDDQGPREYDATFEFTAAELDREELAGVGPVSIHADAAQGGGEDEYEVSGVVKFTADYVCARCAEPYPIANVSDFHVRFRPRPAGLEGMEEVEITEEGELDVEFYSERSVALRDLALEQVQLSIPMKPLCNESCAGLCSKCGSNLNKGKCNCVDEVIDERWGALEDIRRQLAKKNEN